MPRASKTIGTFHDPHRRWTIHQSDVQQVLPTLRSSRYDAAFTDAPYGIGFMQHRWDAEVPHVSVWQQLIRVTKPGAPLLAFGSPKTFHRQACNLEDAGWVLRDTICWLYGEEQPTKKAHDGRFCK